MLNMLEVLRECKIISDKRAEKMKKEAELWENLLENRKYEELYFLLCIGIGNAFFRLTEEIRELSRVPLAFTLEGLVRKGEISQLKEDLAGIIAGTEELFSMDLNDLCVNGFGDLILKEGDRHEGGNCN